jgi:PKD repeat protein
VTFNGAANTAPTANAQPVTTGEDTPKLITMTASDPQQCDLTFSVVTGPANGTLTAITSQACVAGSPRTDSAQVTYTPNADYNGPDNFTFKVNDGTVDSDTATVTVTVTEINDTPIAANDSATVAEDGSVSLDPRTNDSTGPANESSQSLTVSAVSQGTNGTVTFTATGVTYTPNANFNGTDSFTYTVTDNGTTNSVADPESDTATVSVTVTPVNDAPVATGLTVTPSVIDESETTTASATFTDVDGGTHTCTFAWGDGTTSTTVPANDVAGTCSATHQYLDDNPTGTSSDNYAVSVTVKDDGGTANGGNDTSAPASTVVTVRNVAPTITTTSGPIAPLPKATSAPYTVSFTDPGSVDKHTCVWSWDDGTADTTQYPGIGTRSCSTTHTYAQPGVYTVTVTVSDDDGGSDSETLQFLVVVYDPSAGFVTGGGHLQVAAGSYTVNPSLSGRANFGFVAKYKKGATIPEGQTEFQFQVGNLNFHSETYKSLVVSSFKAQYRGTGTINGVTGYDFVVTAYDGQINGGGGSDKFRIKITKGGVTVFDNRIASPEDMDTADPQVIASGSIVIHK